MLQGQHLAVDRVHAVERLLDEQAGLGLDRGLRRRGERAQELGRQRDRVGQRQAAAVQGDLAVGVAELGAEVAAVDLGQLQRGQVPQPEEERQHGSRAYSSSLRATSRNASWSTSESSTRPASRRLSRRWTIRLSRSRCRENSSRSGLLVAGGGTAEQLGDLVGLARHGSAPYPIKCDPAPIVSMGRAIFRDFPVSTPPRARVQVVDSGLTALGPARIGGVQLIDHSISSVIPSSFSAFCNEATWSSGMATEVGPRLSPSKARVAGCWRRPSSSSGAGSVRTTILAALSGGRVTIFAGEEKLDRRRDLAAGAALEPFVQPRRGHSAADSPLQRAPLIRKRRCGDAADCAERPVRARAPGRRTGPARHRPGGRHGRVERKRHAVGLDRHADFGRPPIIARAGQPEASERNGSIVLDQQESFRDRDRRGLRRPAARVRGPDRVGLAAEFDQRGGGVEDDAIAALGPVVDRVDHAARERPLAVPGERLEHPRGFGPRSRPSTIDSRESLSSSAEPICVHQANRLSRPTSCGVNPWR